MSAWAFSIDCYPGRVEYDSVAEEWTVNGAVEGRMAPTLAAILAGMLDSGGRALTWTESQHKSALPEDP